MNRTQKRQAERPRLMDSSVVRAIVGKGQIALPLIPHKDERGRVIGLVTAPIRRQGTVATKRIRDLTT